MAILSIISVMDVTRQLLGYQYLYIPLIPALVMIIGGIGMCYIYGVLICRMVAKIIGV